ncbi:MAG TPA: peptide-N-glycosidase F-related protein, partial [Polyangiaceae bacterium]|nr:peptide-N-glycosidase F-related protein [Polyangiaceae bacterium]
MARRILGLATTALFVLAGAVAYPACGDGSVTPADASDDATQADADADAAPPPSAACQALGLTARAWSAGPYGTHRGEIAGDFTLPMLDGTTWTFSTEFSGCDVYVFLPDTIAISSTNPASVWTKSLGALLAGSPPNVHYFFVSRKSASAAAASLQAMQQQITDQLAKMSAAAQAQWTPRLHVVQPPAAALGNWVGDALVAQAAMGMTIDRRQVIHGVGNLSDVKIPASGSWPWAQDLSYAANEPIYLNAQSDELDRLDGESATVVTLFQGAVLSEYADVDATLPSASQMANFDTLEIEVTQQCPNPDAIEEGNCGAWDYLAELYAGTPVAANDAGADGGDAGADGGDAGPQYAFTELARFITSYHRETHWVVDVTPMLAVLKDGGAQHFRWSFAPPWNVQPTATKLSLRLSNQNKGYKPEAATYLFSGGDFNSQYNVGRSPANVPIPSDAKRVELYVTVTGHGGATNNCSEFCDHAHEFTVNAAKYTKDFPMAGTDDGCIAQ